MNTKFFILFFLAFFHLNGFHCFSQTDSSKTNKINSINHLLNDAIKNWKEDDYEKSLSLSKVALQNAIVINNDELIGKIYNVIGANFYNLTMMEKALFYYNKALLHASKTSNDTLKSKIYNNSADIYFYEKKDYKKGIAYYKKALIFSQNLKDSTRMYVRNLNITWAYFEINNFKESLPYFKYIVRHKDKYCDKNDLVAYNMLNGVYYDHLNQKDKSNYYFKSALKNANKKDISIDLLTTYKKYSQFLERNHNYKDAYKYLKEYNEILARINSDQKVKNASIKGANFEIDKYKRNVDKLESLYRDKEKLLEYEKSRNNKVVGIMISLFIISVILFYFFFQNSKLKQKNKLKDVQRKIQDNIINASIDGQETERKKIAGFLHDNISAMLSSAGMHLKVMSAKNEEIPEELIKTKIILEEAHDRIRDLSHELLPTLLVRFGLFYAIEDLCEKNSNTGIHFDFLSTIATNTRYNEKFEMRIYFIISELLNNISKHSNATKAQVSIDLGYHDLNIHIHDNGVGFDTKKIITVEGFGLNQIRARIKNLNGEFVVSSKKNYGTSIKIKVPILY